MQAFPQVHPSQRAFTLLEVLAVVAITAVLFALIIPASQSMRKAMNSTRCANNIRALGQAAMTYSAENEGRVISLRANQSYLEEKGYSTTYAVDGPRLLLPLDVLAQYFDGGTLNGDATVATDLSRRLACPDAKWPGFLTSNKNSMRALGYGGNPAVMPWSVAVFAKNGPLRQHAVRRPSQVILFADSGQQPSGECSHMVEWLVFDEFTYPARARQADAENVVPASNLGTRSNLAEGETLFATRHKGAGHCVFVDGHVELLKPEQISEKNIFRSY